MARKTSSVLEDLLDISRRLPWYINLLLAAIAYGVLHRYAAPPVHAPAPTTPADITAQVTPMLYRALAMGLQYVIPGVLLVGALLSFLQRRHSASLHDRAAMAPETIRTLSWRDFEHLTAGICTSCSASNGAPGKWAYRSCANSTESWPPAVPQGDTW